MVYCGKISRACLECRTRRTKCDTLRPSCSQCLRAGRNCTGYREPSDLIFRDEAQSLIAKRQSHTDVRIQKNGSATPSRSKSIVAPSCTTLTTPKWKTTAPCPITTAISFGLVTSAEDQATCFFFKNYVLEDNSHLKGNFQYLSDIYNNQEVESALTEGIISLGMAGLANFWNTPNIMVNANAKYNSALRLVSSRLRNVDEAKADQTLVAVMLLGLYETNTCSGPQSMVSWTKHISGAVALLHLRGIQQLRTPVGHHLFVHLRTQVIINCLQRRVAVPQNISEWSRVALEHETSEEAAATTLSELSIKLCSLRATMSSFHDYSNSEHIISSACNIDTELADWATRCPIQYIYNTVTLKERSEDVFSDHYHVYTTIWIAAVWNHYRCIRILVNELILDQLNHVFQYRPDKFNSLSMDILSWENQILFSNSVLLQLSHDICASVPFFLEYHPSRSGQRSTRQSAKAVSGNLLLWPLYIAACTGMVSDMMREWVTGRLRMIAKVMGIRQAAPLAHALSIQEDLIPAEIEDVDHSGGTAVVEFVDI